MKTKTDLKKGIIFALITAITSGVAIFYSKISLIKVPPLILTTSRNLYVTLVFLLLFLINKKIYQLKKIPQKQLIGLTLIGVVGGALPFYLFFTGLKTISPQNANLIHKTLFIWVTILAVFFLKERLNLSYWLSFFLILLANFYFGKLEFSFNQGELLVLLATFFWSIENVLAKKVLQKVEAETVGLFRMGIGSLVLLAAIFLTQQQSLFFQFDPQKIKVVFIDGTILFFYVYFWYRALKLAPASLVTLILSFSTVVGLLLNSSLLQIKLTPPDLFSSLFISLAVLIIVFNHFFSRKIAFWKHE